jgi:hypothetical protein
MPRENRIKVYRSTQGAAPPAFSSDAAVGPTFGEMAFSDGINSLFIGKNDGSVLWIGAEVTGGDIAHGLTNAVPTQAAVKAYVSASSGGGFIVQGEDGQTIQIDPADTLTLTGGEGIDVFKSSTKEDTLVFRGVTATNTTLGIAKFKSTDFQVTNGEVSLTNGPLFSVRGETAAQGILSISFGDTLTITGGPGINVFLDGQTDQIAIQGVTATSSTLGVAAFDSGDFSISNGVVNLASTLFTVRDERQSSVVISRGNTLTITGGPGINVFTDGATDRLAVQGITATNTEIGVASFSATNFTVNSGAVTSKSISVIAGNAENFSYSTNIGSSITITGGNGVKTKLTQIVTGGEPSPDADSITIEGVNATYTTKGVASFKSTDFTVTNGEVGLTTGPLFLLRDEKNSTTDIAFGNTLTITGGPGVNVFLNGQTDQIAVQAITADYTTLGIASFKQGDFIVSSGAVSLTSQLVTSVNGLTGAVTVVSSLPLANTTGTTGVAAFNANFFSVSATGTVSLTTVDGGTWP